MSERVALVGGRFEIVSRRGIGTTLHVVVPIHEEVPT
jgi:signal transduction histidine kinase